jgi:type III restriction enzyme
MGNPFFEHPILNSPYDCPQRHWELDAQGHPTQKIIDNRRRAEFITPIPKPKKRKSAASQKSMVFDEGKGLSTQQQQYDPTSIINEVRCLVDRWRAWPNPNEGQVTPETARLLQHWRHHKFAGIRRRSQTISASEPVIESDRQANPADVQPATSHRTPSLDPPLTFRERVTKQRGRDAGPERTL